MRALLSAVFIVVLSLTPAIPAQAEEGLTSLDELMKVLTAGKPVSAVFHYGQCTLVMDGEEVESIDAIGGMPIDTWEFFGAGSIGNEDAYLSASHAVLINHPRRGVIYNYAKVRMYASGQVEIIAQYFDPRTYEVVMHETFTTSIGEGAKFYSN